VDEERRMVMYGLVKLAGIRDKVQDIYDTYIDGPRKSEEKMKQEQLSDEEVARLVNHLKTNYGIDAPFKQVGDFGEAHAVPESVAKPFDQFRESFYNGEPFEKARGYHATPNKEVILHEAGHIADQQLTIPRLLTEMGLRGIGKVGPLGTLVAPSIVKRHGGDTKDEALATGAVGIAGLGSMMAANRMNETNEDRANAFAKRYMTDELGDAAKAEQWFNESGLPHARNTYRWGSKMRNIQTGLAGLAAGGLGMGIAHFVKPKEQEEA
jgi:hypothetical protein